MNVLDRARQDLVQRLALSSRYWHRNVNGARGVPIAVRCGLIGWWDCNSTSDDREVTCPWCLAGAVQP